MLSKVRSAEFRVLSKEGWVMAERIDRFEDLIAWQRAREMTRAIYYVTRKGTFAKYFGLTNQIQRAAVSVMSNIAEGFERSGMAEFHPRNNEICHAINPDSGLRTQDSPTSSALPS